jgi:transcriptional regulator with GAF, ATPase, and Fis domain
VIFISALEDTADKIKGFNAGAVDYITKPFQPVEVLARIDAHLSLRLLQKQLEAQNIKLQQAIQDITEQKLRVAAQDERLKFEAFLSALSAEFINTAISEVDAKVEKGLRTICDFLGVDRTTLSLFSIADGLLHVTYTYSLPEIGRPPAIIDNVVPEWVKMLRQGEMLHIDDIEDLPADQWCEKKYCKDMGGIKSILLIPLCVGGKVLGTLAAVSYRRKKAWPHVFIQRFRLLGEIFANALERKRVDQDIQKAFAEIEQLKDRLEAENLYLRDKIDVELKQGEIVGQSAAMKRVLLQVKQVAATVSTVLIQGETGTGKELVAQAIHNQSDRKDRPMIKLNCAALPATGCLHRRLDKAGGTFRSRPRLDYFSR